MKKILLGILLTFLFVFNSTALVSAVTEAELLAQIQALTEQLRLLQAQQNRNADIGGICAGHDNVLVRNLTLNSEGADVRMLQNFLKAKGYFEDTVDGVFRLSTQNSLSSYQQVKGILPANGYFGPITRAAVNGECSNENSVLSTNPSVTVTSPNGGVGELYAINSTKRVTFNSSNLNSSAVAVVSLEGGLTNGVLAYGPASLGYVDVSFDEIKNGDNYTKISAGTYKIKVSIYETVVSNNCTNSSCGPSGFIVSDLSDNTFQIGTTVVSVLTSSITSPNSSTRWNRGSTQNIRWENIPSFTGNIDVYLVYASGTEEKITTVSNPLGWKPNPQGSTQWAIPLTLAPGTFKIRLYKQVQGVRTDPLATSQPFSVVVSPSETAVNKTISVSIPTTVTKTNSTESTSVSYSWSANYSVDRSWFQLINNATGEIKNAGSAGTYTSGAGATSRTLTFPAYLNTGTYTFKVCDVSIGGVTPSSTCGTTQITFSDRSAVLPTTVNLNTTLLSTSAEVMSSNSNIGVYKFRFKVEAVGGDVFLSSAALRSNYTYFIEANGSTAAAENDRTTITISDLTNSDITNNGNFKILEGDTENFELTISYPSDWGSSWSFKALFGHMRWDSVDSRNLTKMVSFNVNEFKTNYINLTPPVTTQEKVINVTSQNTSGSSVTIGDNLEIKFDSNTTGTHTVYIVNSSSNSAINLGTYNVRNVGANTFIRTIVASDAPTGTYKTRVCYGFGSNISSCDDSSRTFQLVAVSESVVVTPTPSFAFPNSSTRWNRGSWYTIRWENLPASTGEVDVYLVRSNGTEEKLTSTSQSSFQWTIPSTFTPESGLAVRLYRRGMRTSPLATSQPFSVVVSPSETAVNKTISVSIPTTVTKTNSTESTSVSYSWSANYTVDRSWFQLINNATGEIKNAGSAGTYTSGASATSRTLTFPAYLSTGAYTFKVCDVSIGSVTPSSTCGTTQITFSEPATTSSIYSSKANQLANIREALKGLLEELSRRLKEGN